MKHNTRIRVVAIQDAYAPPVDAIDPTGNALTIMSDSLTFYLRLGCTILCMSCSALPHLLYGQTGQACWGGGPVLLALVCSPHRAWDLHFQATKAASLQHTAPNSISKHCSSELFMKYMRLPFSSKCKYSPFRTLFLSC